MKKLLYNIGQEVIWTHVGQYAEIIDYSSGINDYDIKVFDSTFYDVKESQLIPIPADINVAV